MRQTNNCWECHSLKNGGDRFIQDFTCLLSGAILPRELVERGCVTFRRRPNLHKEKPTS